MKPWVRRSLCTSKTVEPSSPGPRIGRLGSPESDIGSPLLAVDNPVLSSIENNGKERDRAGRRARQQLESPLLDTQVAMPEAPGNRIDQIALTWPEFLPYYSNQISGD